MSPTSLESTLFACAASSETISVDTSPSPAVIGPPSKSPKSSLSCSATSSDCILSGLAISFFFESSSFEGENADKGGNGASCTSTKASNTDSPVFSSAAVGGGRAMSG